jgi:hypothetical protein
VPTFESRIGQRRLLRDRSVDLAPEIVRSIRLRLATQQWFPQRSRGR